MLPLLTSPSLPMADEPGKRHDVRAHYAEVVSDWLNPLFGDHVSPRLHREFSLTFNLSNKPEIRVRSPKERYMAPYVIFGLRVVFRLRTSIYYFTKWLRCR